MNTQEIWQVEVGGQIYEANFEELAQWIAEGALLPHDKVRRGNLRWISAEKVPALYGFFNAKELGIAPPVVTTSTGDAAATAETNSPPQNFAATQNFVPQNETVAAPPAAPTQTPSTNFQAAPTQNFQPDFIAPQPQNFCLIHTDTEPAFVCDGCGNAYCKACPKSFGGTVKVCPMCGAMCKPIAVVRQRQQQAVRFQHDLSEGFGFDDFVKALAYPFKFKTSLIFGAVMFMFFTLGQTASAIGGIFMLAASLFCVMLANMLSFGVLANTVENFSQGKLSENFMPSFDDFDLWDDVLHPFFLSVGAWLVSFGPLLAIVVIAVYLAFSSFSASPATDESDVTRQSQAQVEILKQGEQFKQFGEEMQRREKERQQDWQRSVEQAEEFSVGGEFAASSNAAPQSFSRDTEDDVREAQEMIDRHRKAQLESVVGKTPETQQAEVRQLFSNLLSMALPFLLLAGIAALWGAFYFPAACAVAGYTRSFAAVVNPTVGLDTIRRMGGDYAKLWLMGFLLVIMSGIVGVIFGVVFAAFDMPRVGNLPATACGALFTFYLSVVFSVCVGYALYKNSAKLNLYRG
jgi:hypothetical protein